MLSFVVLLVDFAVYNMLAVKRSIKKVANDLGKQKSQQSRCVSRKLTKSLKTIKAVS